MLFKLLHFIPTAVYQKVIATHMFFDRATSMCFNQLVVLQVSVSKMLQDGEVVDLCPTFRLGETSLNEKCEGKSHPPSKCYSG